MRILMCRPEYYDICYEINAWMRLELPADRLLATGQWHALYETVCKTGAEVSLIHPSPEWPDMVFVANAGLVCADQAWVAQFKEPERQGESELFHTWFKQAGFKIMNHPETFKSPPYFEGAGDALFMGNHLVAGYGFRSDRTAYEHPFFRQFNVLTCELIDPYFYHLDTCFCPLNESQAIWYPAAFSAAAQKRLKSTYQMIDVREAEAKQFACNAVILGQHIILPAGCPLLSDTLENLGYTVHACEMTEFIKAGGACKCLTLRLDVANVLQSVAFS